MYIWNEYEYDEVWCHDMFETKEECIQDAIGNYGIKPGETIYIGKVYEYIPTADVDSMLENMEQDAYEECGDPAEDWYISSRKGNEEAFDELCDRVNAAVNEYLKKIGMIPHFYKIDNVHSFEISKDE